MAERDYVLGTHDDEVTRLGLQHAVWRRQALEGWTHAGFTAGQTLIDIGCGPGYASLDLAEIARRDGRIVAVDRSRRFLDTLTDAAARRRLANIETFEADLDADALPEVVADGAWVRWVFAFVKQPKELVAKIRARLRRGGALVIHEYFDYATWRIAPRSAAFEKYVTTVMESWRAAGGEPDIGLQLPAWLTEAGFTIRRLRPIVDFLTPRDFAWQWPKTFVEVGIERLIELGRMTPDDAREVRRAFADSQLTVTPSVVEIVAIA